ncbi:hypothetical protein THIOM_000057 [Candidatus Thiomargarita nelsonii]|uniref:Uncharacterized protein n=1 Tax=Candidatus Thiomargarita nelsonii TaxID=1003181 RepID=A0A176S830_9GAMM|nr:hypothetical protein THIOM_000057 [Candidatus Thiomargarita nelsonii]
MGRCCAFKSMKAMEDSVVFASCSKQAAGVKTASLSIPSNFLSLVMIIASSPSTSADKTICASSKSLDFPKSSRLSCPGTLNGLSKPLNQSMNCLVMRAASPGSAPEPFSSFKVKYSIMGKELAATHPRIFSFRINSKSFSVISEPCRFNSRSKMTLTSKTISFIKWCIFLLSVDAKRLYLQLD